MLKAKSERLDHLGVIAGVIKDLEIIELIDKRIPRDAREVISTGEAVAGMIVNGLGFSDRPLTLTPQFFQTKAMNHLFHKGIEAENLNRFKLGRALDNCYSYGCDTLFAEISLHVCKKENIDMRFNSLDTTTFSLTGEYDQDFDENTIEITHGYSKDHRHDLKQVILELMTSQDGGIPVVSRSCDGNASDSKIFRERAKNLINGFKNADGPRYLVADSKLYDKNTAKECLQYISFITRIPSMIKLEKQCITKALEVKKNEWEKLNEKERFFTINVNHYGINQRWIIVQSEESIFRAKKSIKKCFQKENEKLDKELKKLTKHKFACEEDAKESLKLIQKKAKFHKILLVEIKKHKIYLKKGRPQKESDFTWEYTIIGQKIKNPDIQKKLIVQKSCYVIGTNIKKQELESKDVIEGYKGQNSSVERGFRFLKDPLMFTSSFFIKKTERIMGLMMVMTLALLVYSIAQKQLRKAMKKLQEELPNQSGKNIKNPTLRWIFQILEGIEVIKIKIKGEIIETISGITNLKARIIGYFSNTIQKIYCLEKRSAQ